MVTKVELPKEIKDVWAAHVANLAKEEELEDELSVLGEEPMTRSVYVKAESEIQGKLKQVRSAVEDGENNLFVAVNNYIVEG